MRIFTWLLLVRLSRGQLWRSSSQVLKEHPEADRNKNGVGLHYAVGFTGIIHAFGQKIIKAVEDAGIETSRIGGELIAEYNRGKLRNGCGIVSKTTAMISCGFACNDDMALRYRSSESRRFLQR